MGICVLLGTPPCIYHTVSANSRDVEELWAKDITILGQRDMLHSAMNLDIFVVWNGVYGWNLYQLMVVDTGDIDMMSCTGDDLDVISPTLAPRLTMAPREECLLLLATETV
jgi:hypothetical protein